MNTCTNETKISETKPFRQKMIKDYFPVTNSASNIIVGCNFNPVSGEEVAPAGISTNEHYDRSLQDCSVHVIDCQDSIKNVEAFSSVDSIGERHNLRKRTKIDYTEVKISDGEAGKKPKDKKLKKKNHQQSRNKTSKYNGERHASSTNKTDETKKIGPWGRKIGNVKEDSIRRQKERSGKGTDDSRKKGDCEGQNLEGRSKVRKVDSDVNKRRQDKIQTDNAGHQRACSQEYEHPDCRFTGHIKGCYHKDVCIDDMGDNTKQIEIETEKTTYCNTIETVQNVVNKDKRKDGRNDHIDAACAVSKHTGISSAVIADEIMPCYNLETVDILEREVECGNKKLSNFFRVKKATGCVQKFDATTVQADCISIQKDDYDIDTYSGINKSLNFFSTCPSSVPEIDFDITDYIDLDNFECIKDETFDINQTTEGENFAALKITRNNVMVDDIAAKSYHDNESGSAHTLKEHLVKQTDSCDNLTDLDKGNKDDLKCTAIDDRLEEFRTQNDIVKGIEVHQKSGCGDGLCGSVMETDICKAAVEDEESSLKDINDMCSVEPSNSLLGHNVTEQIHETINDREVHTGDDMELSEGIDKDHSIIGESASY